MSSPAAVPEKATPAPPMPVGIHNVYTYDVFNAVSWSVAQGVPIMLYVQHLGATATIMAVLASFPPLMNILQIPAAPYVEKVGYRRFVLNGWTTRSFMIVGMTLVTLLPDNIDRTTRIVLILGFSLVYNTLRGISICGLLPWFTHIVPAARRGEFLSKDQIGIALSSIAATGLFSLIFAGQTAWYSYPILFTISSLAAFISLIFLRRVPDVPVEKIIQNPTPVPWGEMLRYPPFLKYLRYIFVVNAALGASGAFWVRFFHYGLNLGASEILAAACITIIAQAATLFLSAPIIDRAGNKPALTASGIILAFHFSGWLLVAAHVIPYSFGVLVFQCTTAGIGGALWNVTNIRCVMGIVPEMGRPHFLALYSVVSNMALGLVPLLWGPVMDLLANWRVQAGIFEFNCYSVFYISLVLTFVGALIVLRSLPEPAVMTWDTFLTEVLVKTPSRAIGRLIGRLRGPSIG